MQLLWGGSHKNLTSQSLSYAIHLVHCFLSDGRYRVDLTQGNANGKNGPIDDFLYAAKVDADISTKDEYRLYRNVLKDKILNLEEFQAVEMKTVLKAREEGLALLKARI